MGILTAMYGQTPLTSMYVASTNHRPVNGGRTGPRRPGVGIGKRQIETLSPAAAADIDAFCTTRRVQPRADGVLLVMSADGKGIVMRPDALCATVRAPTANRRRVSRTFPTKLADFVRGRSPR